MDKRSLTERDIPGLRAIFKRSSSGPVNDVQERHAKHVISREISEPQVTGPAVAGSRWRPPHFPEATM